MMVIITPETWKREVLNHKGVVLVKMATPWCAPCTMMNPMLEKIAAEFQEEPGVKVCNFDVTDASSITKEFNILGVPTVITFKDGVEVDRYQGLCPEEHLRIMITKYWQKQEEVPVV